MISYRLFFKFSLINFILFVLFWDVFSLKSLAQTKEFNLNYNDKIQTSEKSKNSVYLRKPEETIKKLGPHIEKLNREDLIELSKAYSDLNNFQASLKTLNTALSLNSKDVEIKTYIGHQFLKLNKEKDAMASFKEALEINKKFVPAYKGLIQLYEKRKNRYELRILYQDLIDNTTEKPEYVQNLCELYTLDGIYDQTEKYCKRGIQLAPNVSSNYVYLYQSYKYRGDIEKSISNFKDLTTKFPNDLFANLTFAQLLEEKKDYVGAFKFYTKASQSDKKSVTALIGVGTTGVEIQKLELAYQAFEQACKLDRSARAPLRRSTNILKTIKITDWSKKFELLADKCGI